MAGTAGNVLPQPQDLSDFITSSGVNKNKCQSNKSYWESNKKECKRKGWYYNRGRRQNDDDDDGRQNDNDDEQCKKWKKNNRAKYDRKCKNALANFLANYEDADLIFDILTAGFYDEDEDILDGDFTYDVESDGVWGSGRLPNKT